jgi:hypothetical protein
VAPYLAPLNTSCDLPLTRPRDTKPVSGWAVRTPRAGRRPARTICPEGRRGSEVRGGPQGRRLRREAPLSLEGRPGTLAPSTPAPAAETCSTAWPSTAGPNLSPARQLAGA